MKYKNVDVPALAGAFTQKKSRAAKRSNFATLLVFLLPATGALHALLRILFLFWFLKTVQSLDPEGPSYYDFYYEDYLMETFAMMRLAKGYRHPKSLRSSWNSYQRRELPVALITVPRSRLDGACNRT